MAVREHTRIPLRRCRAIRHNVAFTCGAICFVSIASAKDEPADVSHSRAEIEIGARILPGVRSTRRTETTFGDLDFITGIQMIFQAAKVRLHRARAQLRADLSAPTGGEAREL